MEKAAITTNGWVRELEKMRGCTSKHELSSKKHELSMRAVIASWRSTSRETRLAGKEEGSLRKKRSPCFGLWNWDWDLGSTSISDAVAYYTRRPGQRPHPNIDPYVRACSIKAIGASDWNPEFSAPTPLPLATAHYHHFHYQPHHRYTRERNPYYTAQHASRLSGTTRLKEKTSLKHHETRIQRAPRAVESGSAQHLIDDGTCRSSAQ